jgi:hypothetical protein
MNKAYYDLSNPEFLVWLTNFITVITAKKSQLPITDEQITALNDLRTSLEEKINQQAAAEEASRAATQTTASARTSGNSEISFFNTAFKNDKSIPEELLTEMGLKVAQPDTSPAPAVPLELMVTANADGSNELKWKRNGNKQNTIFIIEAQTGGAGNWVQVGATSDTTFTHTGQQPGVEVAYRVKATRSKRESGWSNTAVAYFKA